jgi:hypothetical protein
VSYPDLLFGVTVVTGLEKVRLGSSPLIRDVVNIPQPFSHSLVLTNLIGLIPASIFGYIYGWQAALVFLAASISHWLLDVIVHKKDLPVVGFGPDAIVGFGLWNFPLPAYFFEYGVVIVATLLFEPADRWAQLLIASGLFHLSTINSYFGFTQKNPVSSPRIYASIVFCGFVAIIIVFNYLV